MVQIPKLRKIPRIDQRITESFTRDLPKVGIQESKIRKARVGSYGNYNLRDKLMELISYLKEKDNIIVIPGADHKYFKMLEQQIINNATEMVRMIP